MNPVTIAKAIGSVVGSLFPIIFPNQEFKPKRLIAVIVLFLLVLFAGEYFGFATVENALDLTGQALGMTEEAK